MKKYFYLSLFLLGIDLSSKYLAKTYQEFLPINFWGDFSLNLQFNQGIAFSLPLIGKPLIFFTVLFLIIFTKIAQKNQYFQNKLSLFALSFIYAGALGNLYERIFFKQVTDFIQVFSWYPVFNFADIFIFLGVIILIYFENHKK
jgi:signal peptidase II